MVLQPLLWVKSQHSTWHWVRHSASNNCYCIHINICYYYFYYCSWSQWLTWIRKIVMHPADITSRRKTKIGRTGLLSLRQKRARLRLRPFATIFHCCAWGLERAHSSNRKVSTGEAKVIDVHGSFLIRSISVVNSSVSSIMMPIITYFWSNFKKYHFLNFHLARIF